VRRDATLAAHQGWPPVRRHRPQGAQGARWHPRSAGPDSCDRLWM